MDCQAHQANLGAEQLALTNPLPSISANRLNLHAEIAISMNSFHTPLGFYRLPIPSKNNLGLHYSYGVVFAQEGNSNVVNWAVTNFYPQSQTLSQ
jgi:hypothetical protein